MPAFVRYIGIDYSGAQTPTASRKGLRAYLAEGTRCSPPAARDHQAVVLAGALIGVVQVCQKIPTGNQQIVV